MNVAIAPSPSQYAGAAASTTVIAVSERSVSVPRRAACTRPMRVPITKERRSDENPSASEIGSASAITRDTGRASAKLVPRSACSIPRSHHAYCTATGRSSRSSARIRAASAADAPAGSRKVEGSPGARRRSAKVRDSTHTYSTAARAMMRSAARVQLWTTRDRVCEGRTA